MDSKQFTYAEILYTGGFGVTLLLYPQMYFKGGPAVYWKPEFKDGNVGAWFTKSTGAFLTSIAVGNYLCLEGGGVESNKAVAGINLAGNVLALPLFYSAMTSNEDAEPSMWKIQSVLGLVMAAMAANAFMKAK